MVSKPALVQKKYYIIYIYFKILIDLIEKNKENELELLKSILATKRELGIANKNFETAEIAMQAGQTGHYVLSTIHTIDAIEAITRIRKMDMPFRENASQVGTHFQHR